MRIIKGLPARGGAQDLSVALGNFDGVHRGHQAVVAAARRTAQARGLVSGVATFEPHPRRVFRPDDPPFRLTPEGVKARRLARLGIDRLHVLPFDDALRELSPEAFAADVLAGALGAAHVAVGADFRFGKGRAGDVAALRALGADLGFSVEALDPVGADAAAAFSSSAARAALREARPADAARILGDWHRIEGVVEQGDQRGRDLGYPTANLSLGDVLRPAFGVYAVRAEICDGPRQGWCDGVASLGVRPMFELPTPNLETHLFDFSADIYGATLSVGLVAYLRPEARFDGLDALIRQMDADSAAARAALSRIDPPPWA